MSEINLVGVTFRNKWGELKGREFIVTEQVDTKGPDIMVRVRITKHPTRDYQVGSRRWLSLQSLTREVDSSYERVEE